MFDLGFQELVVIFAVAIMVIGPKRIPEFSRKMGKMVGQFKKAFYDVKHEINREMDILDQDSGGAEPDEPKWKREAMEAIYGKGDAEAGDKKGPGEYSNEGVQMPDDSDDDAMPGHPGLPTAGSAMDDTDDPSPGAEGSPSAGAAPDDASLSGGDK